MYEVFFGLRERPFGAEPDPRFLVLTESHLQVLRTLEAQLSRHASVVVLTGEPGVGKTMLLQALMRRLPARTAGILMPRVRSWQELEAVLADRLGERADLPDRDEGPIENAAALLRASRAPGQPIVLAVDDAERLSPAIFEMLGRLSMPERDGAPLASVLLAGRGELADRLRYPDLRPLAERVAAWIEIPPLTLAETEEYIFGRLEAAGSPASPLFTEDAVRLLHTASGGVPRAIDALADASLVSAFNGRRRRVGGDIVRIVAHELNLEPRPPARVAAAAGLSEATRAESAPPPAHAQAPPPAATVPAAGRAPEPPERQAPIRAHAPAPAPSPPAPAPARAVAPTPTPAQIPAPAADPSLRHLADATDYGERRDDRVGTVELRAAGTADAVAPPAPAVATRAPMHPRSGSRVFAYAAGFGIALLAGAVAAAMLAPSFDSRDVTPPALTAAELKALDPAATPIVPAVADAPIVQPATDPVLPDEPASTPPPAARETARGSSAPASPPAAPAPPATAPQTPAQAARSRGPAPPSSAGRVVPAAPRSSGAPPPAVASSARGATPPAAAPSARGSTPPAAARSARGATPPATAVSARGAEPVGATPATVAPPASGQPTSTRTAPAPAVLPSTSSPPPAGAAAASARSSSSPAPSEARAPAAPASPPAAGSPRPDNIASARPSPAAATPSPATAAPASPVDAEAAARASIQTVLDQYRQSVASLDASQIQRVWPGVDRRAMQRAFDQLEMQAIEFDACRIGPFSLRSAMASCTGRSFFKPRVGSREPRTEQRRWSFQLSQRDGAWIIERVEAR